MSVITTQAEPLTQDQVENNAGGFVWTIDPLKRLQRFLCLGCEGGTYYQGDKELGIENAQSILALINSGRGLEAVSTIKTYSIEGRTSKQNPIMFALALCAKSDNLETKRAAYDALNEICRIPTHLFMFLKYALALGQKWGRAQRRAVSNWYLLQKPDKLVMAVTKYQNREGYTHRDALRLSHPKTSDPIVCFIFDYVTHGLEKAIGNLKVTEPTNPSEQIMTDANEKTEQAQNSDDEDEADHKKLVSIDKIKEFLEVVEKSKNSTDEEQLISAIREHHLVREHMPTTMLKSFKIWLALLEKMPLTAMIRNLGKMSEVKLFESDAQAVKLVVNRLENREQLQRARIHPFNLLVALETYKRGKGVKGKLSWDVNEEIKKALEDAFYLSFKFIKPTNQRYLLALDVSGSMSWGGINGSPTITPATGSCAMAMVTLRTEPFTQLLAFSHELVPVNITKEDSLSQAMEKAASISMGGTDCALPMVWAMNEKKDIDVFVVYTDNETWFGGIHPAKALKEYRAKMNKPNAKLIVVGMTATEFSIADPNDLGMLDIAGFDSAAPQIMSLFAEGSL